VFDFIKKGGEIRLWETLATHPVQGRRRCQNLIPALPGDDKINTETMNTIHLTDRNFIMPLMPMCMQG